MEYPIKVATDMLIYQGRDLIYIYRNLLAATVLASKGSDISISYSLKLNRYPLVLKKVNKNASKLITIPFITGIESVSP